MIFCTRNNGAIPGLKDCDIVEITCNVSSNGVTPKSFSAEELDSYAMELIRRMKLYEREASAAILTNDKKRAIEALALHPLVESYSVACELMDRYIELNKDYCRGW